MVNMYRMLFLALKRVQMIKITPCQIPTTQQKNCLSAKFPIAPTGENLLPFNAIWKSMNFSFAQKEDFLGKLTKISITFVYLLFFNMLTFSSMLENPLSRSWDLRLHNFEANCTQISHILQKGHFLGNYIQLFLV